MQQRQAAAYSSSSSKPTEDPNYIMNQLVYACDNEWSLPKRIGNVCILVCGLVVVAVSALYVVSSYMDETRDGEEEEQPVWMRRVFIGIGAAQIVVLLFVIREYFSKLWMFEKKMPLEKAKSR